MLTNKFRFIWPSGFTGDFKNRPIRNNNHLWWPCFLMDRDEMSNLYIEPLTKMLSTKFQFIWQSGFRGEDFFRYQPIRNKNCLWWPCLLTDRDEMSNIYRGPSIDACFLPSFGSFGMAISEKKIFQKSTNQKQKLPVAAIFVNGSGRNEQSLQRTFHRCFLPSFGLFGYMVSQEKIFYKSTNQKQELWWPCFLTDRDEMSDLWR